MRGHGNEKQQNDSEKKSSTKNGKKMKIKYANAKTICY